MRTLIIVTLTFFVTLILGCSKGSQAGGKITFADGSPLTCGEIVFDSAQRSFAAAVNPQGTYQVSNIPDGTYQVYIGRAVSPSPKPDKPDVPLVAKKFTRKTTSGLECNVQGNTVFDIQVEKP